MWPVLKLLNTAPTMILLMAFVPAGGAYLCQRDKANCVQARYKHKVVQEHCKKKHTA